MVEATTRDPMGLLVGCAPALMMAAAGVLHEEDASGTPRMPKPKFRVTRERSWLAVKRAEWLSVGEKNFQTGSSRMQTKIESALCDVGGSAFFNLSDPSLGQSVSLGNAKHRRRSPTVELC